MALRECFQRLSLTQLLLFSQSCVYISGDDDELIGEYKAQHAKKLLRVMETMDDIDLAATVSEVSKTDMTCTIQIRFSLKFSNSASQPDLIQQSLSKLRGCLGARFHAANTESPSPESLFGSPSPNYRRLEPDMSDDLNSIYGEPTDQPARYSRLGYGASEAAADEAADTRHRLSASSLVINNKSASATSNKDQSDQLALPSSQGASALNSANSPRVKQERTEILLGSSNLTIFGVNFSLEGIDVGDSVLLMCDRDSVRSISVTGMAFLLTIHSFVQLSFACSK